MSTVDGARESVDEIDVAVAAYFDEEWQVGLLPNRTATEIGDLVTALRGLPSTRGTLGMVSVDEDFFVLVRVTGESVRLMLSDVCAAEESPLAATVLERLGLPMPGDDDEDVQPGGDLRILADLGVAPSRLAALCDDLDSYPDEILSEIAHAVGFGREFDEVLDTVASD